MGTIADKLTYLNATKTAIKSAIVNKGVSVADSDTFRSYADKIASIETGIEEISTADAMTALLVEANVGKVYRFTGTTDDTYTNGDLYEVMQEEIADGLAGTWGLNDTLNFSSLGLSQDDSIFWSVNFTTLSGIALNAISIGYNSSGYYVEYKEVTGGFPTPYPAYYSYDETGLIGWQDEGYKTITITSKLSEVTNGDNLLAWLQANATKQ